MQIIDNKKSSNFSAIADAFSIKVSNNDAQCVKKLLSGVRKMLKDKSIEDVGNVLLSASLVEELSDSAASQISGGDLVGDLAQAYRWRFGRADGSIIADSIILLPDGGIDGYSNPNEAAWRVDGQDIVFVGEDGAITTRFTDLESVLANDNRPILSGAFIPAPQITHTLTALTLPT